MNVSDEILSNLSSIHLSQNEGSDAFISIMQKNAPLLIIPASAIFFLMSKLTGLKKDDSLSSEREIKTIRHSALIIFSWICLNIFGYYWIYVIDQTYYLLINNMLSLSWVGLIVSSLGFVIRELIMEFVKNCFAIFSRFHKILRKIIRCVFDA